MSHPSDVPPATRAPRARERLAIRVNGEPHALPEPCTVAGLVAALGLSGRKIAVAVNREVVPRSRHSDWTIRPGDHVEVLEAVGGG